MKTHEPIPKDWPVRPLSLSQVQRAKAPRSIATCGHCGLSWNDAVITDYTPAPSARCPFEEFHVYPEEEEEPTARADALADARKLVHRILVQTGDVDSMAAAQDYRFAFPRLRAIRQNAEELAAAIARAEGRS